MASPAAALRNRALLEPERDRRCIATSGARPDDRWRQHERGSARHSHPDSGGGSLPVFQHFPTRAGGRDLGQPGRGHRWLPAGGGYRPFADAQPRQDRRGHEGLSGARRARHRPAVHALRAVVLAARRGSRRGDAALARAGTVAGAGLPADRRGGCVPLRRGPRPVRLQGRHREPQGRCGARSRAGLRARCGPGWRQFRCCPAVAA